MKFTITGSLGNISKPLTAALLASGHQVTVISSSPERAAAIEALGATAAIGSVTDVPFLTNAFKGSDAVYTMVPPNYDTDNWKKDMAAIGANYAKAIQHAGVQYVVNLSSIGAHLPGLCGPVSGLYAVEQVLNELKQVHIKHLRPGMFYQNYYAQIDLIRHQGIMGENYDSETRLILADTADIAAIAAEELQRLDFSGKTVRYIASDERSAGEVAAVLGKAIGKPGMAWVSFSDEDLLAALLQHGFSGEIAANYVEMGVAVRNGKLFGHYMENRPSSLGAARLEDFARKFAAGYEALHTSNA